MMPSLTDVSCVAATFAKLSGFVFNVTKHGARAMSCSNYSVPQKKDESIAPLFIGRF
jgi:hypothetical protein